MWDPELDSCTEKDTKRKSGRIPVRSVVYSTVLYQLVNFLVLIIALWLSKLSTSGKTR